MSKWIITNASGTRVYDQGQEFDSYADADDALNQICSSVREYWNVRPLDK